MKIFGSGDKPKRNSGNASNGGFTLTGVSKPKRNKAMEWPRPTDKTTRQERPR